MMMKAQQCTNSGQEYTDFGVFTLDEVLPYAVDPRIIEERAKLHQGLSREEKRRAYIGSDGKTYFVKISSSRYWLFKNNPSCIVCGRSGNIMVLQRSTMPKPRGCDRLHFNMYAVESDGMRVLMTKDHVRPKSMGGADSQDNYQTMCRICNVIKANRDWTPEKVREFARIRNPNMESVGVA